MHRFVAVAALCVVLVGCQTARPIYYWGAYEAQIYQGYSSPGKATPEQQIETLKADLEKAKAANLSAPPGLHAHLGFLYAQAGKADLAVQEFETEKRLFPESASLIDSMLKRSKPSAKP